MRRLVYLVFICAVFLAAQVLAGQEVSANGKPVKVVLTYLPNVSNWGPANASGVAEVVEKEGLVRMDVVGLPSQSDGVYSAWLINTQNNQTLSVGTFNTNSTGVASKELVLPTEIPDAGWNLVLITLEPTGQTSSAPGAKRSIGGYFPDSVEGQQLPSQLPKTGGETGSVLTPTPPGYQGQSSSAAEGSPVTVFDGLAFGTVGLAAIVVGFVTRAKLKGRQTRSRR